LLSSSRLLAAALVAALAALAAPALAAPHLTGAKPEPPSHVRTLDRAAIAPAQGARAALALAEVPTAVRVLLLRVDFPADDDQTTTGTGEWTDASDPEYWLSIDTSRFASYYAEVSYGHLSLEVVAMPPAPSVYRLPQTMRHYGSETDSALEDLIYDSVTAASIDPTNPVTDFAAYDAVLIVHAGVGEESDVALDSSDDIWSLFYASSGGIRSSATGLALTQTLRDGQPIGEAIIMPQSSSQDGIVVDPLGVYVHEFGHWLGLPDLYCTAGLFCFPDEVGRWSIMGDGIYNRVGDAPYGSSPAHLDAWSKMRLGWLVPLEASPADPGSVLLPPVETEPAAYRLPVSSDPAASAQYFLVENRQQIGTDAGLPGHGLLVWLVDEAVIGSSDCSSYPTSRFCQNTVNNSPLRPGVKLVEADDDDALQKRGCSGAGIDCGSPSDPFPGTGGVVRFTPTTTPSSRGYSGSAWVSLCDVGENSETRAVALTIGFGPNPPQGVTADAQGNVSWTAADGDLQGGPSVGFNVYRSGVLATSTPLAAPTYLDPSPTSGATYQVTAIDAAGNESDLSAPGIVAGGGADSRCFIATAAYGSSLDPSVDTLRAFRDRYLLTNPAGRAFVAAYYRWSPPAAEFIREHEAARRVARCTLTPLVAAIEHTPLLWVSASAATLAAAARRRRVRTGRITLPAR